MSEEGREPTLEELMAELDSGSELPSTTPSKPTPSPSPSKSTDTKEVKSPAKAREAPVAAVPPTAKAAAPAEQVAAAEKRAAGPDATATGGGEGKNGGGGGDKDDMEKLEESFYQVSAPMTGEVRVFRRHTLAGMLAEDGFAASSWPLLTPCTPPLRHRIWRCRSGKRRRRP